VAPFPEQPHRLVQRNRPVEGLGPATASFLLAPRFYFNFHRTKFPGRMARRLFIANIGGIAPNKRANSPTPGSRPRRRLHRMKQRGYPAACPSASRTTAIVRGRLDGFTLIESIPSRARNWAISG